jgi:hypothetical protein
MASLKRVRVIKKIQEDGVWRYISVKRNGTRYVWDDRPGTYFLEWWEGVQRRRETASQTAAEVIAAKRRKQDELRAPQGVPARPEPPAERPLRNPEPPATKTPLGAARELFPKHVQAHSPDKPATAQRYGQVLRIFSGSSVTRNSSRASREPTSMNTRSGAARRKANSTAGSLQPNSQLRSLHLTELLLLLRQ